MTTNQFVIPENDDLLIQDYSSVADGLFSSVRSLFESEGEERLAFSSKLPDRVFKKILSSSKALARKTLEAHEIKETDENPFLLLGEHIKSLTNITANGALIARKEMIEEMNHFQKTIIDIFENYNAAEFFDFGQCPVNLRISELSNLQRLQGHPHPSIKYHTDTWAGEPIDSILFMIPVFNDGPKMNIELVEATPDTEKITLRAYDNYDQGNQVVQLGKRYDIPMNEGDLLVCDSRLLHRTTKEGLGRVRVSIDFRFRLKMPVREGDLESRLNAATAAKNVSYFPFTEWQKIGSELKYIPERSVSDGAPAPSSSETAGNHRYMEIYRPKLIKI